MWLTSVMWMSKISLKKLSRSRISRSAFFIFRIDNYFKYSLFLFIQNSDCLVKNCSSCLFFKKCFTASSKKIVFWLHLKTMITGFLSDLFFSHVSTILSNSFNDLQIERLSVSQSLSSSSAK